MGTEIVPGTYRDTTNPATAIPNFDRRITKRHDIRTLDSAVPVRLSQKKHFFRPQLDNAALRAGGELEWNEVWTESLDLRGLEFTLTVVKSSDGY